MTQRIVEIEVKCLYNNFLSRNTNDEVGVLSMAQLIFMAFIGALIGWFTNYLAIKLIFRPQNPIKIPFIGYEIQGLIPKRRSEIAKSVGVTIANELFSMQEVLERLIQTENKALISQSIQNRILLVVQQKLPSLLPSGIRKAILHYIGDVLEREVEDFMDSSLKNIIYKIGSSIDIGNIVEEKINQFDLNKLEEIILQISKNELKHIEYLGGFLGFVIGVTQGFIIIFLG
jgi:uncharacterized membrane protein YheB (UPF0754 family)